IHRLPGLDERHDTPHILRAVETYSRIDATTVDIAREVGAGVQASTHDELLPLDVESGVLQVRVVLVGPEPMDLVVRDALAEHVTCRRRALLVGVLPISPRIRGIEIG